MLLMVGDIDPPGDARPDREVLRLRGQKGYQPPKIAPEPPQTAPRSAEIAFPGRTLPILTIAYKGDAFDPANRDYVAARLLGELAFGPQSELYKKLVLREQRVEMLDCDIPMNRDQPLFEITAMVKKAEDVEAVRDEIYRTLEEFKTKPVDPQKLDDLKRRDRYAFLMGLDTPEKVAGHLARFVAVTGGIEAVDQLFAASDTVTPEEIMHAAGEVFRARAADGGGVEGRRRRAEGGSGEAERLRHRADRPVRSRTPLARDAEPSKPLAASQDRTLRNRSQESPPSCSRSRTTRPISFRLWFKVGSQDDPPGKEGLAAITAAMIAEGATQSNSYEQILDKLFPLAAGYSASTVGRDDGDFRPGPQGQPRRFYPLLIDAVREPAFKQEDLDRIKSQTLNYLENTLRYSSDEELGKAVLYNAIFAGTPYGHLPAGTVESVRGITLDDVKDFYRKHYTRENVVIGLAAATTRRCWRGCGSDLAALARRFAVPTLPPPEPAPIRGRQVTIVEKDCNATAISIGFPIDVLRGSKDWYALAVANLARPASQSEQPPVPGDPRGPRAELWRLLVHRAFSQRRRVAGAAGERLPPAADLRDVDPARAERGPAFRPAGGPAGVAELVDHGMTEEEFNETRDFLRKFVLHLAPTTMDRLGYALDDRFYGIDGTHLENFRRAMDERDPGRGERGDQEALAVREPGDCDRHQGRRSR